jgi:2-keto-4-pentenoate hydratase/2-oxohepta-3-ene-1,7-dioic acid hydratase in catechol pathway
MKIGRFLIDGSAKKGIIEYEKALIEGVERDLRDLIFLPPSTPRKIVCVGLNYFDHAQELGMEVPAEPVIFLKPDTSLNSHESKIILPNSSGRVDYEAELAIVIGKRCKKVKKEDAADYILGLTCFNDITARDLQERDIQWTRAKSFDGFAPAGPWVVTKEEFPDLDELKLNIKLTKNGKIMQSSDTSNLIFHIPYLVEFISSIMTLEEGDIVSTGTPPGVGRLDEGDVVEVAIEKIGTLRNFVERERV